MKRTMNYEETETHGVLMGTVETLQSIIVWHNSGTPILLADAYPAFCRRLGSARKQLAEYRTQFDEENFTHE